MISTLDDLSPAAQTVALRFIDAATAGAAGDVRAKLREGLAEYLCERLDRDASPEAVEAAAAALGPVTDELAGDPEGLFERLGTLPRLRDLADRIAKSWWDPADDRLWVPRVIGIGWDLNLGALAVRLGLIEPDAEAVPFAATDERAFRLAAAVPGVLAAAVALHYAVRGRSLPPRLPSHWGIDGRPDRWIDKGQAAAIDLGITGAAAGVAAWTLSDRRPGPQRAGAVAGAAFAASLAASSAVVRGLRRPRSWAAPLGVLASAATVAGVLYGLARNGRANEIHADLSR